MKKFVEYVPKICTLLAIITIILLLFYKAFTVHSYVVSSYEEISEGYGTRKVAKYWNNSIEEGVINLFLSKGWKITKEDDDYFTFERKREDE